MLEKKTSSAEAAAASGICNEAGNEVGETKSAEAPAVVTEEALLEADEMESESPTQPLDQLNEALMEESQDQKDERYVVKATPMTAGSSGLETPPTSSETMVKYIFCHFSAIICLVKDVSRDVLGLVNPIALSQMNIPSVIE